MSAAKRIDEIVRGLDLESTGKPFFLSAAIGIVAALAGLFGNGPFFLLGQNRHCLGNDRRLMEHKQAAAD